MIISKNVLEKYFQIEDKNLYFTLRYKTGRNVIHIEKDFALDGDCATLARMMPDGSLIKDLRRIYFHQKKDIRKIYLFRDLLVKLFNPPNRIFIRDNRGTTDIYINSRTLAVFFHHIMQIPKSDQEMRVPPWIFNTSADVKIAYLKQAFDMEGTIVKGLCEIRFITKDYNFAVDICKLLEQVDVESHVKDRIGRTYNTLQYRVSIYKKHNFANFKKIGFSVPFNAGRFNQMIKKYNL